MSYPPFYSAKIKVAELLADGEVRPFPNLQWLGCQNSEGKLKDPDTCLNWVLGVRTDVQDRVWLLDSGQQAPRIEPKLVAWDTRTNQLDRIIDLLYPLSLPESQHNYFVISSRFQVIVIADDGIALDEKQEWLYFAPLNIDKLYRIAMTGLINSDLADEELSKKVKFYAYRPNSGGLSIDSANNLYLTEVGERRIGIIPADTRKYRPFAQDPRMIWPDGISFGKEGYLYTGAAQLPLSEQLNEGKAENSPPHYIFRFKPLAKGVQSN